MHHLHIAVTIRQLPQAVAHADQGPAIVVTNRAFLVGNLIRQELMVKARRRDDLIGVGALHEFEDTQQHHGDNTAATGRADDQQTVVVLQGGRRHAGEHALAGADAVGFGTHQPIGVGGQRLCRKVVHFVVQQHAGAGRHVAGAEGQIDRQCRGDVIALAIQDRKVGGAALRPQRTVTGLRQAGAEGGSGRRNTARQAIQIRRRQQIGLRHLGKRGVAQIVGAVAIGAPQGFGHQVLAVGFQRSGPTQTVKQWQHLCQGDAAGRRQSCAGDRVAAPLEFDRPAFQHAVVAQVTQTPDSTVLVHAVHQHLGGFTFVETFHAPLGDALQGQRQLRLAQQLAFSQRLAAGHEDRARGRRQTQLVAGDGACQFGVHPEALHRQPYRRAQRSAQRQFSEGPGNVHQRRRLAGYAGRQWAITRQQGFGHALAREVHVAGCRAGRHFAAVDHQVQTIELTVQQPESAAAQARARGLDDRQGSTNGNRRIKGVAAGFQDLHPGLGGQRVGAGHRLRRRALIVGQRGGAGPDRQQPQQQQRATTHGGVFQFESPEASAVSF